jgi:phosphate transport system substrate-binding protein
MSDAWRDGPRASSNVQWPTGQSAEGNGGMAEKVHGAPGAISYAEASFAKANQLATVALKNRAGAFVASGPSSFAKAAEAGY